MSWDPLAALLSLSFSALLLSGGGGGGPACIRPALNLAANVFWSKEASFSLRSAAPFLGDPLCCGEFSADFLLLSTSLAIATRRSKPIDISSCHLLVSSGAEPSPEEEVAGFLDKGGETSGLAGLLRESSPVISGV